MPSADFRRAASRIPLGGLATLGLGLPEPNPHIISTMSWNCIGEQLAAAGTNFTSQAPVVQEAILIPFEIAHPFLVRKVFWANGGTVATDSCDVGVYTEAGTRVVSGGGTAMSGTNATQEVDVTDTVLVPGRYWLACVQNGNTALTMRTNASAAAVARACGAAATGTAYPLPSTITPGALSAVSTIPLVGIASRTLAS